MFRSSSCHFSAISGVACNLGSADDKCRPESGGVLLSRDIQIILCIDRCNTSYCHAECDDKAVSTVHDRPLRKERGFLTCITDRRNNGRSVYPEFLSRAYKAASEASQDWNRSSHTMSLACDSVMTLTDGASTSVIED